MTRDMFAPNLFVAYVNPHTNELVRTRFSPATFDRGIACLRDQGVTQVAAHDPRDLVWYEACIASFKVTQ